MPLGVSYSCRWNCCSNTAAGWKKCLRASRRRGTRAAIDQLVGGRAESISTGLRLLAHVPPQARPVFLPLALVRRDLQRHVAC